MTKKILSFALTILFSVGLCLPSVADYSIQANLNITVAEIKLSSSMSAQFSCSTKGLCDIKVTSVKLQVKNSDGTWSAGTSMAAPDGVSNASALFKSMSYSSSCTKGKTYRITAVFNASGETVSRTSNEATYK